MSYEASLKSTGGETLKLVYNLKNDLWSVYIGNDMITVIDREHPYAREILREGLAFEDEEFGKKLGSVITKKIADFNLEFLLAKEEGKAKITKKAAIETETRARKVAEIKRHYLRNKEKYEEIGFKLPDNEDEITEEHLVEMRKLDRLLESRDKAREMLSSFNITDITQRAAFPMLKQACEETIKELETAGIETKEIKAKLKFYEKLLNINGTGAL